MQQRRDRKVELVDVIAAVGVEAYFNDARLLGVAPVRRELALLCRGKTWGIVRASGSCSEEGFWATPQKHWKWCATFASFQSFLRLQSDYYRLQRTISGVWLRLEIKKSGKSREYYEDWEYQIWNRNSIGSLRKGWNSVSVTPLLVIWRVEEVGAIVMLNFLAEFWGRSYFGWYWFVYHLENFYSPFWNIRLREAAIPVLFCKWGVTVNHCMIPCVIVSLAASTLQSKNEILGTWNFRRSIDSRAGIISLTNLTLSGTFQKVGTSSCLSGSNEGGSLEAFGVNILSLNSPFKYYTSFSIIR